MYPLSDISFIILNLHDDIATPSGRTITSKEPEPPKGNCKGISSSKKPLAHVSDEKPVTE
jgi:hypothetical protein